MGNRAVYPWNTEVRWLEKPTHRGGHIPGFKRLLKFTIFFFPNIENVPTNTRVFNIKKQAVLKAEVSNFPLMFSPMEARKMQGHIYVPRYLGIRGEILYGLCCFSPGRENTCFSSLLSKANFIIRHPSRSSKNIKGLFGVL